MERETGWNQKESGESKRQRDWQQIEKDSETFLQLMDNKSKSNDVNLLQIQKLLQKCQDPKRRKKITKKKLSSFKPKVKGEMVKGIIRVIWERIKQLVNVEDGMKIAE